MSGFTNSGLKWSDGSSYQQSKRPAKNNGNKPQCNYDEEDMFATEYLTPLARALTTDESWTVDGDGTFHANIPYSISNDSSSFTQQVPTEFKSSSNKREETYNKMAERQMVGQTSMNPFLGTTQASYANDVASDFLMPVSVSQDKV